MWDVDHFPGADHVPWPLLIRARYVFELDAALASTVLSGVGKFGSAAVVQKLATAADEAIGSSPRDDLGAEQQVSALQAVADFDDWCGTPYPHWRWPFPPRGLDTLSDPLVRIAALRGLELIKAGGSAVLQKQLGSVLAEVAGVRI